LQRFYTEGAKVLPAGKHQVRMEFTYDGGGLAKGGKVVLLLDGKKVGEGRVNATQPMLFSADETMDVGYESASSVSEDYTMHSSAFNGTVSWVKLDTSPDDSEKLITADDRLRVAMARQ
jgi:hypothetical protein